MKIAYLSSSTIPSRTANSIHVMKMCQAFARNGHEVTLLAPDKRDDAEPNVPDPYAFYGVDKCFEIIKLPWLPIRGRGHIYGLLAGLKARSLKPDLVYCRNASGCFFASKLGLPVTFESHAPLEDSGPVSEWMFRRLLKSSRLQKLVVITHALKKYYQENYSCNGVQIQVAPDGADPVPEGTQPVDLPNKCERLQVGYVGHLYAGKGMEVVGQLALQCSWADFHVVGGLEKDISYWKENLGNSKNINFYGFVPHEQVSKYIYAFDVVLLPNQNQVEAHGGGGNIGDWTSPLKLFEYMASGKAIICSDLPVLREVVEHEKNALLCPPDDVDEWVRALERLRQDKKLAKQLGKTAHDEFIKNYTWQARAERLPMCQDRCRLG
ncbi:glycosyltransferase family 4 protein [Desulfonatronovibrio hydrogenovorans]|uniref:glycosyltransferase family 4 protein n=1 Tax=Desulfonatronovibrio hydrogenovorans TaxID=53245 RepID=UPI00048A9197|nr:glycosyltransferase family 4 protein [Desulfonatronovibrio hydrogenovorans]